MDFRGSYINGKREGYWERYNTNGQLMWKGNYKDYKQVGYWESYDGNGKLLYVIYFVV